MTAANFWRNSSATRTVVALLPFAALLAAKPTLPEWALLWPENLVVPFVDWINGLVDFLKREEIFAGFTFKDLTRAIASVVEWPLDFADGILIAGFKPLPPLPWIAVVGLAALLGWRLKGPRLALLAGGCVLYLALFGKWKLSMITLSAVLVAAPIAGGIGLALGIFANRSRWFERALRPILNVMQSLPHFSYLIPVAVFVGVSHKAGVIATILFAIPPMARLTLLGLQGVSNEVLEAGRMAGCTSRQMLWKVEIPAARKALMIGVNQVIMQCLAMVVIASFIGTKGLGHDLLARLNSLQIGRAFEIGVAIVFMAIMLDRLSTALAERQPTHRESGPFWKTHPAAVAAAAIIAIAFILAAIFPAMQSPPKSMTITTAPIWDGLVDYITVNYYDSLAFFRDGFLEHILIPMRRMFQWTPWLAVAALVAGLGWRMVGWRAILVPCALLLFIPLSGYWERAAITAYMVTFSVLICIAVGVPLGIWAAGSKRRARAAVFICDTMQTFPSFIYLIPVIMLFRVGDVAAITAIVIYAIIPAMRYTIFGLRQVPKETIEAAIMSGCAPHQLLWKVRLPLAFPEIMLGVNQTVLFGLFMVVIAAFIGTQDLGQEIFRARADNDAGAGLVIGLCVAFMGLIADYLITGWAGRRKRLLGIA